MRKYLVALLMSSASAAVAADMPAPLPVEVYDWSGVYIGVNAGVGGVDHHSCRRARILINEIDCAGGLLIGTPLATDLGALSTIGGLGGGQGGIQWQYGQWVFGLEGDIQGVDWGERVTAPVLAILGNVFGARFETDYLATARARIGWTYEDVLFYVTGGVAALKGDFRIRDELELLDDFEFNKSGPTFIAGVVGAGIEWAFTENLSVKAEGLYLTFDEKKSIRIREEEGPSFRVGRLNLDDAVVTRVGLNFRFNLFH